MWGGGERGSRVVVGDRQGRRRETQAERDGRLAGTGAKKNLTKRNLTERDFRSGAVYWQTENGSTHEC
jgi:hypothetical protein